ncbi:MAG: hypothetical protein AAGH15_26740 [Myxococcota bacterium]
MRRCLAGALGAVFLSWCAPPTAEAPIPAGTELSYALDVSWEGASSLDGAWVFETDLGYRVGVRALYIGLGALELVACPDESLASVWAPARARADHAWDADASRLDVLGTESLMAETSWALGPAEASGTSYCELFWTVGTVASAAADGFELTRASAYLDAWVEPPGTGERIELEHWLLVGEGVRVPLEGAWAPGRVVRLTRHPARAFDGLVFESLSAAEVLFEVVQALGNGSRARFAAAP